MFSFFHSMHSLSFVIQPIIYPWPGKKCLLSKIDWYCTIPLSGVHGRATRQHSSMSLAASSERLLWPIILADAHTLCFEQCITMSIFEFTDKNFYIWLKSWIQTNFLSSIHLNLWVIFQDQGDCRDKFSSSASSSAVYFFA